MISGFEDKVDLLCKRLVNYCNSLALYCTCMLLIFVIVCGFLSEANMQVSTLFFLYLYCLWRSNYQKRGVGIPMTKLTCQMIVHVPSQDLHIYKIFISYDLICLIVI